MSAFTWIRDIWKKIPIIKNRQIIRQLRWRHRDLTATISERHLYGPHDLRTAKEDLQLVDDLIVHNLSIQFNRVVGCILLALAGLMVFLCVWRSSEAPIFMSVKATRVKWRVANTVPGANPMIPWHMSGNEKEPFGANPLPVEGLPDTHDTTATDIVLYKANPEQPVEINHLSVPDKCFMSINFADSLQSEIIYEWRDSVTPPPVVQWKLAAPGRKSNIPSGGTEESYKFSKLLELGVAYNIPLQGLHKWRMPMPVRVTEIFLETSNWDEENRSSIISGKLKLLNTYDPAIELNRGDWLNVKFKDTVDLYLAAENGIISVETSGLIKSLKCGPVALGKDMNRMPRLLKTVTDQSPYLLSLGGLIVPLLIALMIRQRKSI